jgi:2-dehydro-3-deoxyphosphooctonate aldolase (KDO 8-P synthase)
MNVANSNFQITDKISVGNLKKLLLIAGPCQIESIDLCQEVGEKITEAVKGLPINVIFKSSYDKANRTSLKGMRGIGIEKGLEILDKIRKLRGFPILTDIHDLEQAKLAGEVVDVLQIPAFLCRQTDLLLRAGESGKTINVKKGQFLAPQDMKHVADKIASTGNNKILLCERGSCFGYRDLIVDMRSLVIMRESGYPVIFDATHSVQQMGGESGASGGNRKFIAPLLRAAVAAGVDGIFIECHPRPDRAPSDSASMLPTSELREVLEEACALWEVATRKRQAPARLIT